MQDKLIPFYVKSAGVLLLITAAAKLISSFGNATILNTLDPVFSIPFRYEFWIVGGIEMVLGLFCLFGNDRSLQAGLTACLATSFVVYRIAYVWIKKEFCECLGTLTDMIHISPQTADSIAKAILIYLLLGSYATLFALWKRERKAPVSVTT